MAIAALYRTVMSHPLGSRRPLHSFGRIASWQLRSRLQSPRVVDWVNGRKLSVSRGDTGATGNIYFHLHEVADMAFFAHLLRPGDVFIDAGANIGSYTILASANAARIESFEPAPETVVKLRRNIELNGADASIHTVALGHENGQAHFTFGNDCVNALAPDGETVVEVRTLDSFDFAPVAMKMDLEGGEENALAGASATLKKDSLLALEVETVSPASARLLEDAGFARRWYDPFSRAIRREPTGRANNQLWVRDEEAVARRVAEGPDIRYRDRSVLAAPSGI